MEDNKQTQPENPGPTAEEVKAQAEALLEQVKGILAKCQEKETAFEAKCHEISDKTTKLSEEQSKLEDLLGQITQAKNAVDLQKKAANDIMIAVKEKQTTIDTLATNTEQAKKTVDSNNTTIQDCKVAVEEIKQNAVQSQTNIDTNQKAIAQSKIEVDTNTKAVQKSKADVDLLEAKLKAIADTADEKTQTVDDFATALEELNKLWGKKFDGTLTQKNNSLSELHKTFSGKHKELEEKIESLLPGATSAGLSSAFMNRKESIEKQKTFWRNMTLAGAGGLVLFGIIAIFCPPKIENGIYDFLLYILTRSSILVGIVMIEEFGRRHFNIISRLSETYAYKEVLSRSFEGYKKQMENVELDSTITTTELDAAGKESKKTVPMKASSKLSDNLLDNLREDPASIYEKEKPVPTPVIDVPGLAAQSINKAVEQLGKNKFDVGWRVFAIAIFVIVATATTIVLLVK